MNILQKIAKFFANQILEEILTKTSILMQNCIEDVTWSGKIGKMYRDLAENLRKI